MGIMNDEIKRQMKERDALDARIDALRVLSAQRKLDVANAPANKKKAAGKQLKVVQLELTQVQEKRARLKAAMNLSAVKMDALNREMPDEMRASAYLERMVRMVQSFLRDGRLEITEEEQVFLDRAKEAIGDRRYTQSLKVLERKVIEKDVSTFHRTL